MSNPENSHDDNDQRTDQRPAPLIPAATVLLVKDIEGKLNVLMLRRNRSLRAFAGAWVFPGGRVDPADAPDSDDEVSRARTAAIRETMEETGLDLSGKTLAPFSRWIPPIQEKRRFSTWFFLALAPEGDVKIDEGEIHDYGWLCPKTLIAQIPDPELHIMPPTYVSLWELSKFDNAQQAMQDFERRKIEYFETRFLAGEAMFTTFWPPDPACEKGDLSKPGLRKRLIATGSSWNYIKEV